MTTKATEKIIDALTQLVEGFAELQEGLGAVGRVSQRRRFGGTHRQCQYERRYRDRVGRKNQRRCRTGHERQIPSDAVI